MDLLSRQFRQFGENLVPLLNAVAAAAAMVGGAIAAAAQARQSDFVLWPDAQRVSSEDYDDPDWTLGRIDDALTGWDGLEVDICPQTRYSV
jgi:hypothetical protein